MRLNWSWPLLGKELVEQAARKRTYVVRVVYAGVLLLFFGLLAARFFQNQNLQFLLGRGRMMLDELVVMQFFGIYLFLPAMMAGAITAEKERDSLALLFLTDMRPWELLLQKYVGRLVPMFTFLLLSLPPMAVAYSLGGIEPWRVATHALVLVLACSQVGALALMCSTYCRTTVAAFLATYFLGVAIYFGPVLVVWIFHEGNWWRAIDEEHAMFLFPPYVAFESSSMQTVLWRSVPLLISTLSMLWLARLWLVWRASVPARRRLLGMFRRIDRFFSRLNQRFGGVLLAASGEDIPADEPVAWRETTKGVLGTARYLFRVFIVLEAGALALGLTIVFVKTGRWIGNNTLDEMSVALFLLWGLAVLALAIRSANLVVSEHTHQTLEVLLTTPLTAADIIRQKMRGIYRLVGVFAVPLLTLAGFEAWWEHGGYYANRPAGDSAFSYLVASLAAMAIYLPLVAWVSLFIGLKMRTRFRAIMMAIGVWVVWCAGPPLMVFFLAEVLQMRLFAGTGDGAYLFLLSPASAIPLTEFAAWHEIERAPAEWVPACLNFFVYGIILWGIRWWCLRNADRYLRR